MSIPEPDPTERYPSSVPGDRDPDIRSGGGDGREKDARSRKSQDKSGQDKSGKDVQPGTGSEGTSWQSRSPDPDDKDDQLNQALKDSFPASDPPQSAQPGVTGWDKKDEDRKTSKKSSP